MEPGAVVNLRTLRHYTVPKPNGTSGVIWEDWSAPKGHVYVAVIVGTQPIDGSEPLDPEKQLKKWGWTPPAAKPDA